MSAAIPLLLLGEAGLTAMWLAGLVSIFSVHDWPVQLLAALRASVAAMQCAGAVMWINRRPRAAVFARGSLVASALLRVLEVGLGLSPSSVFPTLRWIVVTAYWGYALAAICLIQWLTRSSGPSPTPR